jgi:hypothetical protein
LSKLTGRLIRPQQVFEPLELVEDDEVRLEGGDANTRQLVAKCTNEQPTIPQVLLGSVFPMTLKAVSKVLELVAKSRLSALPGCLVVLLYSLGELANQLRIDRRMVELP